MNTTPSRDTFSQATPLQLYVCESHDVFHNARPASVEQVLETAKQYAVSRLASEPLEAKNPEAVSDYLVVHFAGKEREIFSCLFLDNSHRLIEIEDLFFGTINGAHVSAREIVKAALKHNAAAVILAHNHPSGVADPSTADYTLTSYLREALDVVDIRVLDHIVVGGRSVTSMAEMGALWGPPSARKKHDPTKCANCNTPITQPKRGRRVYCSPECREGRTSRPLTRRQDKPQEVAEEAGCSIDMVDAIGLRTERITNLVQVLQQNYQSEKGELLSLLALIKEQTEAIEEIIYKD